MKILFLDYQLDQHEYWYIHARDTKKNRYFSIIWLQRYEPCLMIEYEANE